MSILIKKKKNKKTIRNESVITDNNKHILHKLTLKKIYIYIKLK